MTARGIYRELLDVQWDMVSLPGDPRELRVLIGATPAEWKCWPLVEPKFPIAEDGRRRNPRLEEHRRKAAELQERQRTGGAKGNEKRWGDRQ